MIGNMVFMKKEIFSNFMTEYEQNKPYHFTKVPRDAKYPSVLLFFIKYFFLLECIFSIKFF